jgi:threonine aldolase
MLVGSRELIARAHRWRKVAGGGMRQTGVLAAAAAHALEHHIDRLAHDHANARALADGLRAIPGITVTPPDTNIVFAALDEAALTAPLVEHLKHRGVLATGLIGLRFVTHMDVDAHGIEHTLNAVREFLATKPTPSATARA